jgi:ATP-dependent helicase/nuclease subunit B
VSSAADGGKAAGVRDNIFTVAPGRPFLTALAGAVLNGDLPRPGGAPPDALALPATTILLPTRRAARALQEAFLSASCGRALLLPRISPIAEANEELTLLTALSGPEVFAAGAEDIAPAVSEIERRVALTGLVLRWTELMRKPAAAAGDGIEPYAAAGAGTAAQAAKLAAELARLMDDVETENVSLARLKHLVPDAFSAHWQKTLEFLDIVLDWWPQHLAERGVLSPMERRNRLILAEARRLGAKPAGPVIVAGVTGSIPATVELMRVAAGMPEGAIVLPGLDQHLDTASWQAIVPNHPEHPQFGLKRLIEALGIAREDVRVLPGPEPGQTARMRQHFLSEALRPAATTERWHSFIGAADRAEFRAALSGISCLEAPTTEDEAEAIALIMREAAETPGRTAALVARDRLLARRVATRLEAWGIIVDDSGGRPLAKTMPGTFLDLVIEAQHSAFAPVPLMALLKHPLTRLGLPAGQIRRAARALEIAALRTAYFGRGIDGVEAALERAARDVTSGAARRQAVRSLHDKDWQAARELIGRLERAFAPLSKLCSRERRQPLREFVIAHIAAAEALAALPETKARCSLWDGEAGEVASVFLAGLIDESLSTLAIVAADYPDLYRGFIAGEIVRPRVPAHPRLAIWGPLEARLQQADVVILGGLNEGTWPEAADPGPWLNRPMRQVLGLPQPEERIGHAAHDFVGLLGAPRVYLTRAQKIDGVPTVASRWLLRLQALLDGLGIADAVAAEKPWLAWAMARNDCSERKIVRAPEPRPPVLLRPRRLSVTEVESWIANPYAIFAGKVLALAPLPMLGAEPDAALRGSIIHQALARFATTFPVALPADPERELLRIAEEVLADYLGNPRIAAFWLPRLERFAAWFGATEPARRSGVVKGHAEVSGTRVLDAPGGPFTLRARADRIDVRGDGIVITDYKSSASLGSLKSNAERGYAPQLALEAAIALASGFAGIEATRVAGLRYISTSGGEPAGAEIDLKVDDFAALARDAEAGLKRLIAEFDRVETPYRAVRRPRFSYQYDDYAHLARAAEWAGAEAGED